MVLPSVAVLAGAGVSALLVGAGLLALAARALGQLRRRAGGCVLPAVAGQLDVAAVKDTQTPPGPEYASGAEVLADLIVLRHDTDIPVRLWVEMVEGRWWNMQGYRFSCLRCPLADGSIAVATPSGRFEIDAAGRVAEVWELASPEWGH